MYGTGPVAQAAAYHAAGVRLHKVAPILGVPIDQVSSLLLGFWLHEARDQDSTFALVDEPGICRIGGCGAPEMHLRLCSSHAFRYYAGRPLLGGGRGPSRRIRVETCVACGAIWCRLRGPEHKTCGAPECLRTASGRRDYSPTRRARDEAILARVRAGESYRSIAADYGLSEPRIGQMARRASVWRRGPYRIRAGSA